MKQLFVDGVEIDLFLPTRAAGAAPPCLVLVAGTGWLGGLTKPGFLPLNRMVARHATGTGYACALVFCRHRCITETCGVEVLSGLGAAGALLGGWQAAAAASVVAGLGYAGVARALALAAPAAAAAAAALAAVAMRGAAASRRRRAAARGDALERAVADAATAWAHVRARAADLGVDGGRLALGGYSSGAQLALLLALRLPAPPRAVVLVSGALLDVDEGFHAAWDEPAPVELFRVGKFARAVKWIIDSFIDDILDTRSPADRARASLPADVGAARLRASRWRVSLCANELAGFQPYQRAFFDHGFQRLTTLLRAADADLATCEIAGNHWTLPLHIDDAFAALLPRDLLDD